jgi:hypothetical protein
MVPTALLKRLPMRPEKRKKPRKTLRYNAWLTFPGSKPRGCMVADISETGARLDVDAPDDLPEILLLLLTGNGRARRKCRIVWRSKHQIGVQFEHRSGSRAQADSDAMRA